MADEVYRKVVDDAGVETYEAFEPETPEIDIAAIPDEAYREDARFKAVVNESIKRRKRLQELAKEDDGRDEEVDSVDTPPPSEDSDLSMDAMFTEFEKRLADKEAARVAKLSEADAEIAALVKEHGLSEAQTDILRQANDKAAVALMLGKLKHTFDDVTEGGNISIDDEIARSLASYDKRMFGD